MHRPPKKLMSSVGNTSMAMLIAATAAFGTMQPAIRSREQDFRPASAYVTKRNRKRLSGAEKTRLKRQKTNAEGRKENRTTLFDRIFNRRSYAGVRNTKLINGMTNWQNHQWCKAGCPQGIAHLEHYAALTK